jgi:hypothetical protein
VKVKFNEEKLKLKVNREKSGVRYCLEAIRGWIN